MDEYELQTTNNINRLMQNLITICMSKTVIYNDFYLLQGDKHLQKI